MRLTKRQLAGIGLATSLTLFPGCSDNHAELEPTPNTTKTTDFNPKAQALAGRILELTPFASGKFTSKPPYTYGFAMPTDKGGMLSMSTQLSTRLPDSSKVETIQVSQSGIQDFNYDISFIRLPDNTWSAYCSVEGKPNSGISEEAQKKALLDNEPFDSPEHADAILEHYIYLANEIADDSKAHMPNSEVTALNNVCKFNLGG